jgi:hypothetical protein
VRGWRKERFFHRKRPNDRYRGFASNQLQTPSHHAVVIEFTHAMAICNQIGRQDRATPNMSAVVRLFALLLLSLGMATHAQAERYAVNPATGRFHLRRFE